MSHELAEQIRNFKEHLQEFHQMISAHNVERPKPEKVEVPETPNIQEFALGESALDRLSMKEPRQRYPFCEEVSVTEDDPFAEPMGEPEDIAGKYISDVPKQRRKLVYESSDSDDDSTTKSSSSSDIVFIPPVPDVIEAPPQQIQQLLLSPDTIRRNRWDIDSQKVRRPGDDEERRRKLLLRSETSASKEKPTSDKARKIEVRTYWTMGSSDSEVVLPDEGGSSDEEPVREPSSARAKLNIHVERLPSPRAVSHSDDEDQRLLHNRLANGGSMGPGWLQKVKLSNRDDSDEQLGTDTETDDSSIDRLIRKLNDSTSDVSNTSSETSSM